MHRLARTVKARAPLCTCLALLMVGAATVAMPATAAPTQRRCGWFENPTPANAWLRDRDGLWIISTQGGGSQAEGEWPSFSDRQWIRTNGSYGYGCACMTVTVDRANQTITRIVSSTPLPLSRCRRDKALQEPERP